jgi:hypothetical protein
MSGCFGGWFGRLRNGRVFGSVPGRAARSVLPSAEAGGAGAPARCPGAASVSLSRGSGRTAAACPPRVRRVSGAWRASCGARDAAHHAMRVGAA